MSRRLVAAILAILVGGCIQPAAEPLLDDPREILGRTLAAGVGLKSTAVRIEVESVNPGMPAQSFTAEGLVDLANAEAGLSGRAGDGSAPSTVVVSGGNFFSRNGAGERWQMVPVDAIGRMGFGIFGPAEGSAIDLPIAIAAVVADPTTVVELKGVEDCEGGRCYRTAIVVDPARAWKLFLELTGVAGQPGVPGPDEPPTQIPPLNLEILSATSSFLPIEIVFGADSNGSRVAIRALFSRHNEEVAIEAPPAALVDRWDAGFDAMPPEQVDLLTPMPSPADGS